MAGWSSAAGAALYSLVGAGFAVSAITVAVGRLHDQNLSGWWVVLLYGAPAAAAWLNFVLPMATANGLLSSDISLIFMQLSVIAILPLSLFTLIFVGGRPGTSGVNRFGPEIRPKVRLPNAKQ
jgi:uncharacterized membrane protein YhaH (DUF805 family)